MCGYDNSTDQDYSFVAGTHNRASAQGQAVVGTYASENSNLYFMVGAGTSENQRKNILEVGSNYININGTLKINDSDIVLG